MRSNTRKAFRATATVAGVAALGATFAGTAVADTNDIAGDSFSSDSEDYSGDGLDSSDSVPSLDQDGLSTFEVPTLQTRSDNDDPISGLLGGHEYDDDSDYDEWDEDWDDEDSWDDEESDDCGDQEDESDEADEHGFQHPVQCDGNNFGEGSLQILGQEIGDHDEYSSMRTDSDSMNLMEQDEDTDANQYSDTEDTDFSTLTDSDSEDGPLSGHRLKLL